MKMHSYIALGSNLGKRHENIHAAIALIKQLPHSELLALSPLYETDPVGYTEQGKFINAVCCIYTALAPYNLLQRLLLIEQILGRERTIKNGPRTIDLDIVLHGEIKVESPTLNIPHPRMQEREFVMRPLNDILIPKALSTSSHA
jgi:2-amino-4-hydroxy-6-hydroxymethyldihydropteridine diphosphokinase